MVVFELLHGLHHLGEDCVHAAYGICHEVSHLVGHCAPTAGHTAAHMQTAGDLPVAHTSFLMPVSEHHDAVQPFQQGVENPRLPELGDVLPMVQSGGDPRMAAAQSSVVSDMASVSLTPNHEFLIGAGGVAAGTVDPSSAVHWVDATEDATGTWHLAVSDVLADGAETFTCGDDEICDARLDLSLQGFNIPIPSYEAWRYQFGPFAIKRNLFLSGDHVELKLVFQDKTIIDFAFVCAPDNPACGFIVRGWQHVLEFLSIAEPALMEQCRSIVDVMPESMKPHVYTIGRDFLKVYTMVLDLSNHRVAFVLKPMVGRYAVSLVLKKVLSATLGLLGGYLAVAA